ILGLPADLRAHGRRTGELHAPARDVRVPGRRGDGPPGRGRRDLPLHAPGALRRRLAAAALPATNGGRVRRARRLGSDRAADRAPRVIPAGHGRGDSPRARALWMGGASAMVIERRWKAWVYCYIPLRVFVVG